MLHKYCAIQKQKGTGTARVGSIRNPARVHGGRAFGPKPRKYNKSTNRPDPVSKLYFLFLDFLALFNQFLLYFS